MIILFTIIIWCSIFILLVKKTYQYHYQIKKYKIKEEYQQIKKINQKRNYLYAAIVLFILIGLFTVYLFIKGTIWESHYFAWLNLIVRWMHITFGIAWIGASFYFVFLENALNRTKGLRDELAGNLWAIHGGGFYYLEKYKLSPKKIPKELHWFKYEAYFTWLTGFSLLFIVYYFNAKAFLIDPKVLDISPTIGILIGVSSIIIGWFVYDLLCKKINPKGYTFAIIGLIVSIFFAWFYAHVFSGRAAYIHFGALLGTIMAANVFFVIIPAQKAMVKAAKKGEIPDEKLAKNAGRRSLHNNYLTLPVLFVMISNHFPSTYSNAHQWVILIGLTLASVGVKHYLNLKEKGQISVWVFPVSVILLLVIAFATGPKLTTTTCKNHVAFIQVQQIISKRCLQCHSTHPTDDTFKIAPNGITFNNPKNILNLKNKIYTRVVLSKDMPFTNKTKMTQKERDLIECWIKQESKK